MKVVMERGADAAGPDPLDDDGCCPAPSGSGAGPSAAVAGLSAAGVAAAAAVVAARSRENSPCPSPSAARAVALASLAAQSGDELLSAVFVPPSRGATSCAAEEEVEDEDE